MGFRFGFSIKSYDKIQNFRSIRAMKLFLSPFQNCHFPISVKNFSVSHRNKNVGELSSPRFKFILKTLFVMEDREV